MITLGSKLERQYRKLLEESAELIITLQSWGLHECKGSPLLYRDADTGAPIGGWAGQKVRNRILKIRNLEKSAK
jgi:hypothetical protein